LLAERGEWGRVLLRSISRLVNAIIVIYLTYDRHKSSYT
jgi:hypothetical protein